MDLVSIARNQFNKIIPKSIQNKAKIPTKRALYAFESFKLHGFRNMPIAVELETNSHCTRTCGYCPRSENDSLMSESVFCRIVNELSDWGFAGRFSPHGYNEPLTDRRIISFLDYARIKLPKSEIIFYTNGDLINKNNLVSLINTGVDKIKIALHEPVFKEDELRNYADQYENIKLISFKKNHMDFALNNRGGLVEFENAQLLDYCVNLRVMAIRSNGNVVQCPNDVHQQYIFGNINNNSLKDVWFAQDYINFRKNLSKGNLSYPLCSKCGFEK